MSLRALWWFLAISLPILASLIAKISTVDLAYQLRAGAEILAMGRIPTTDTWTFTMAGQPWVDQQWAAQVILRAVESVQAIYEEGARSLRPSKVPEVAAAV